VFFSESHTELINTLQSTLHNFLVWKQVVYVATSARWSMCLLWSVTEELYQTASELFMFTLYKFAVIINETRFLYGSGLH